MSCDIEAVSPAAPVHRLARRPDVWSWPDWAYAGNDGTFGNRWDDPRGEYRVLYASTERVGAFVETLARFRPDPALVAALDAIDDEEELAPGVVPAEWLNDRAVGEATLLGEFARVGATRSLVYLRGRLAQDLDAAAIRQHVPRRTTQAIGRVVFDCGGFAGVQYESRLGDDIHNWAVFEPADVSGSSEPLAEDDPDLALALALLGLRLG
jgi:RES domain